VPFCLLELWQYDLGEKSPKSPCKLQLFLTVHRVICIASIHFAQKLALVIIAENISTAEVEKIVNLRFLFQPLRKGVKNVHTGIPILNI
jgi:hypothetical protein